MANATQRAMTAHNTQMLHIVSLLSSTILQTNLHCLSCGVIECPQSLQSFGVDVVATASIDIVGAGAVVEAMFETTLGNFDEKARRVMFDAN